MKHVKRLALSAHELQTLTWSARGMSSAEIASALGLTKRNVDFYLDQARAKLGAATRIQAVAMAVLEGLIKP